MRNLWQANHLLGSLYFTIIYIFQSRQSPFYFWCLFPLIPKYLEMQNHSVAFYCPSFYPDESSFNRHVSLHQMHYVILLSSAERRIDTPLGLMWNDGFSVPILQHLWLGRVPRSVTKNPVAGAEWGRGGLWPYYLSLLPPCLWEQVCLLPGCHIQKLDLFLEKKSLVIKLSHASFFPLGKI